MIPKQGKLLDTLTAYRDLGIGVAIDDVGAGYSELERIASLEPDYLKLDLTLVRDIHLQEFKRTAFFNWSGSGRSSAS